MSREQKKFIRKYYRQKIIIVFIQLFILLSFIFLWQFLSDKKIINSFMFSSPLKVVNEIRNLYISNNLFQHIKITVYETLLAFAISVVGSFIISIILYMSNLLYKIFDPYLTCLNSLPKVALGPMIIIVFGANIKSIIAMAVLINIIVSTLVILNGFFSTDKVKIKLMKSFNANKFQLLRYLIIPNSYKTIISSLKLSISMSLIGVITGEFLVSKAGLGYLIIYGTQVFNLNLVISGIILLIIISYILYKIVCLIEKKLIKDK